MGRVLSSNISLAASREASLGVLPGSPSWQLLEPNAITKLGAELTKVVRSPISKNRMQRKGAVTDLNSGVEFESDLTMDHFIEFMEAFIMASFAGPQVYSQASVNPVTAVTATGYTVASGGALPDNTLIFARGFINGTGSPPSNNGLKVTAGGSTATEIKAAGLTAEAAIPNTRNVSVEVAGRRGATADITMTAQGNLASTLLDFNTLNWNVGQVVKIGGVATVNQFATAGNNFFARIATIATNLVTFSWRSTTTFGVDAGAGKQIDIYTGRWLRNVDVDHASWLERSYTFEAAYENLANPGPGDAYEYPKGNMANEVTINLPLADKATMRFGFIGTDTPSPTTTRATNASSPKRATRTVLFNTTSDIARLTLANLDESGLTTDFKNLSLTFRNNVTPEKVLGTLGAKYVAFGISEGMVDADVLFDNPAVVAAMRENTSVALVFGLANDDGGFYFDVPYATIEGGGKEFPVNQLVVLKAPIMAAQDPTLGYTLSVTHFPFLP